MWTGVQSFLLADRIFPDFYRFIQVLQRQRKRMTQMAAMHSGERLAVSTML